VIFIASLPPPVVPVLQLETRLLSLTWVAKQEGLNSLEDLTGAALRVEHRQPGWFE
jgi:hypothetical protein